MQRSTKIITAVALTFGIAGGALAYGKHKWGDPETRAKHAVAYVADELELDDAQTLKLETLKDTLLSTGQKFRTEVRPARGQLVELIGAESFDRDRALSLITGKTSFVEENAPEVLAAMGDFFDSLSAEQKAEVVERIEHRRERWGRWH